MAGPYESVTHSLAANNHALLFLVSQDISNHGRIRRDPRAQESSSVNFLDRFDEWGDHLTITKLRHEDSPEAMICALWVLTSFPLELRTRIFSPSTTCENFEGYIMGPLVNILQDLRQADAVGRLGI